MNPPAVHPFLMSLLRGGGDAARHSLDDRAWEAIVGDAARNGLTPLLHRRLQTSDSDLRVPPSALERIKAGVFALAARNLALARELVGILRAFEASGVAVMPLRGVALAERLYGEITARPMGDLDLLVRKEDLPRVGDTLRGLGFQELEHRRGFAQTFSYTLVFLKERHGWIIVEPHWTIAYPPRIERFDMKGVWQRAGRGRVAGVETWLLGREDLLLHLCLHLAHPDGTAPLLWFYEVDRLLRQEGNAFDWPLFCAIAGEAKAGVLLSLVLGTVKAGFDTPIPSWVLAQLSREPSVEGRLLRMMAGTSDVNGKEEMALFLTLPGVRARLSYALGLLFPSPRFMRLQSGARGPARLGAAYVRRVCRLVWEGSRGMARLLR